MSSNYTKICFSVSLEDKKTIDNFFDNNKKRGINKSYLFLQLVKKEIENQKKKARKK